LEIFTTNNLPSNLINNLEYLYKITNKNLYSVTNSNTTDGNAKIAKN